MMNSKNLIYICFILLILAQSMFAAKWDWEDGTLQSWKSKMGYNSIGDTTDLTNTTERAYEGLHSLKYTASGTAPATYDWYLFVEMPDVTAGEPIYLYVWIPSGVGINAVKPYMRAGDSSWVDGTYTAAQTNSWMEVVITPPTNVPLPFRELGLQIHTSGNPANFYFYLDNVVSGIPNPPANLIAMVVDTSTVSLDWDDNSEADLDKYYIYRSQSSGFPVNDTTLLDSSVSSSYLDTGLLVNNRYYYKVTAIDTSGNHSNSSNQVSVYLSTPGSPPDINVVSVNTTTPGLYEKFEVLLDLQNADYTNPYDPDEIDITAYFTSPTGVQWKIFGFFDDYNNAASWKVRFAANEVGTWSYYVIASEADGADTTTVNNFDAVQSNHHGWIHVSDNNQHYLEHDDGTQFYGVGAYSPWGNSVSRFNEMASYGFNMFAIWNINYGGFVNSTGLLETDLAVYNQLKCGRIDSMITISESNDIKIMYCIWPHDLFSATVWATQWQNNPYRFLCNAEDVYHNTDAWNYQTKLYRYMIARFAYSRSWGIWEIINEMNGTDGWAMGYTTEAYNWVQKVDQYMKANDPYFHPTTASFSGGFTDYRTPLYTRNDMPNIHIYESQGWPGNFPNNPFRSSISNFAFAAKRFWDNYVKPAIFGEAGANSYLQRYGFSSGSPEFTQIYHNAIWTSAMNGLSMTPVWWDYTFLSANDFSQLTYFKNFVDSTQFSKICQNQKEFINDNYDLFLMYGDTTAIGWMRQAKGYDLSGKIFQIDSALNDNLFSYELKYFNTWTGNFEVTDIRPYIDHIMLGIIPGVSTNSADVAFQISPASPGITPNYLEVLATKDEVFNDFNDTTKVFSYIFEDNGRFCSAANNPISFTLIGPGELVGSNPVNAVNGSASIFYVPSVDIGDAKIIVTSAGLIPDTVNIKIHNKLVIDNFESYATDGDIQSIWQTQNATDITPRVETSMVASGQQAGAFDYDLSGDRTYAISQFYFTRGYNNECAYLNFWITPDGSNREITIRIRDNSRRSMDYAFELSGTTPNYKTIAFTDFTFNSDSVDITDLEYFRFTIRQGNGTLGAGTIIFDDIQFLINPVIIANGNDPKIPKEFTLHQNYPNPFNNATVIEYEVPEKSNVKIKVYNSLGQLITTLLDKKQDIGYHKIKWTTDNMASGVYYYRMEFDSDSKGKNNQKTSIVKKCVLIK